MYSALNRIHPYHFSGKISDRRDDIDQFIRAANRRINLVLTSAPFHNHLSRKLPTSSEYTEGNSLILARFPHAERPRASFTRKNFETNVDTAGVISPALCASILRRSISTAAHKCVDHEA